MTTGAGRLRVRNCDSVDQDGWNAQTAVGHHDWNKGPSGVATSRQAPHGGLAQSGPRHLCQPVTGRNALDGQDQDDG